MIPLVAMSECNCRSTPVINQNAIIPNLGGRGKRVGQQRIHVQT